MTIPGELAVGTWTGGMGGVTCVATSGDATGTRGWSTNIMGGMNSGACSLTITSVTSRIDTGVKRYSLRGTASATLAGGGATAGTTTTLSASF